MRVLLFPQRALLFLQTDSPPQKTPHMIEHTLERLIFASRWIMASFYLGLKLIASTVTFVISGVLLALVDKLVARAHAQEHG